MTGAKVRFSLALDKLGTSFAVRVFIRGTQSAQVIIYDFNSSSVEWVSRAAIPIDAPDPRFDAPLALSDSLIGIGSPYSFSSVGSTDARIFDIGASSSSASTGCCARAWNAVRSFAKQASNIVYSYFST